MKQLAPHWRTASSQNTLCKFASLKILNKKKGCAFFERFSSHSHLVSKNTKGKSQVRVSIWKTKSLSLTLSPRLFSNEAMTLVLSKSQHTLGKTSRRTEKESLVKDSLGPKVLSRIHPIFYSPFPFSLFCSLPFFIFSLQRLKIVFSPMWLL